MRSSFQDPLIFFNTSYLQQTTANFLNLSCHPTMQLLNYWNKFLMTCPMTSKKDLSIKSKPSLQSRIKIKLKLSRRALGARIGFYRMEERDGFLLSNKKIREKLQLRRSSNALSKSWLKSQKKSVRSLTPNLGHNSSSHFIKPVISWKSWAIMKYLIWKECNLQPWPSILWLKLMMICSMPLLPTLRISINFPLIHRPSSSQSSPKFPSKTSSPCSRTILTTKKS